MAKSLYVHVPFCLSRCDYCSFYSGEDLSLLEGYPSLAASEMRLGKRGEKLSTLYLGGGTPGLLGPRGISLIIDAAANFRGFEYGAEITVETNPAVTRDFSALKEAGANRVSIGVQALDDKVLQKLGRRHSAKEALTAVEGALSAGLSVSADLIYGHGAITAEEVKIWAKTLSRLGANHLSAYSLEIPQKRSAAKKLAQAGIRRAEGAEGDQWKALAEALGEEGLQCYEVSNFARPSFESRHNRAYWSGDSYDGVGPGAHGYIKEEGDWGSRHENLPSLEKYRAALIRGEPPPRKTETLARSEALLETLFLALRQRAPLKPAETAARYGFDLPLFSALLASLAENGDLEDGGLTPSLKGMRRADGLALWLLERLA